MPCLLTHCSHPTHPLVWKECPTTRFICNICRELGSGLHYRCDSCDFDLHKHCAELPETISFFAHPWHNLHLRPGTQDPRICDLCREPVEGFFYRCITCNFDVHPHCTTKKQTICTELHPEHNLCLVPGLCICSACHEFNGIWLYRCGLCNVNLHVKCVHGPIKPKLNTHAGSGESNNQRIKHRIKKLIDLFLLHVGSEAAVETAATVLVNTLTNLFQN